MAAAAAGTEEAKIRAEKAAAEAAAAAEALEKAAADKTAVLAAIADARRIHHELHPEHRHPWYEGGMGRGIGFLALVLLGFGCYLLARKGARWEMEKG